MCCGVVGTARCCAKEPKIFASASFSASSGLLFSASFKGIALCDGRVLTEGCGVGLFGKKRLNVLFKTYM